MVVLAAPACVQGFLQFTTRGMSRPQAANLRMMVFALLIGGSGKLRTLADRLQRAAAKLLRSMRPRKGERLSLLIDETIIAKNARTMDAVRKNFDPSRKRFCTGHALLVVAVRFRGG